MHIPPVNFFSHNWSLRGPSLTRGYRPPWVPVVYLYQTVFYRTKRFFRHSIEFRASGVRCARCHSVENVKTVVVRCLLIRPPNVSIPAGNTAGYEPEIDERGRWWEGGRGAGRGERRGGERKGERARAREFIDGIAPAVVVYLFLYIGTVKLNSRSSFHLQSMRSCYGAPGVGSASCFQSSFQVDETSSNPSLVP